MTQVSVLRLHLLRAGYALLIVGLGIAIWPGILNPAKTWEMMHGVVVCMLGAMSALAIVGIRHPLRMLPLLFFELAWKTIWLIRIALPLWLNVSVVWRPRVRRRGRGAVGMGASRPRA